MMTNLNFKQFWINGRYLTGLSTEGGGGGRVNNNLQPNTIPPPLSLPTHTTYQPKETILKKKSNFPRSGGKLGAEIFPQLSRISPVLGEIGRRFDYFLYLYNYKCINAEK